MRGQASTEYLFLLGVLLIIMIPAVYFSFSHVNDEVRQTQLEELVGSIQQSVNTIYRLGTDSQEGIRVAFPAVVVNISAANTKEIVVVLATPLTDTTVNGEVVIPVLTQVVGKFSITPGIHRLIVRAMNESLVNVTDVVF